MSTSDHSMIAVSMPSSKPNYKCPRPPFRFEAMWLRDPCCAEIVEDAWMEGLYQPNDAQISNCLDSCWTRLFAWNKTEFGHFGRQITRLEKELQNSRATSLTKSWAHWGGPKSSELLAWCWKYNMAPEVQAPMDHWWQPKHFFLPPKSIEPQGQKLH